MVGYCFWDRRQQLFPQLGRVPGDVFDFHPIRGKASRDVGSNKGPMRLKGSGFNSALGIPPGIRPPSKEEPTSTTSFPTASRGFVSRYGNLAVERLGGQLECELAGRCRKMKDF